MGTGMKKYAREELMITTNLSYVLTWDHLFSAAPTPLLASLDFSRQQQNLFLFEELEFSAYSWEARNVIASCAIFYFIICCSGPPLQRPQGKIYLAGLFHLQRALFMFSRKIKNLSTWVNAIGTAWKAWNLQVSSNSKDVQDKCTYLFKTWEQKCMQQIRADAENLRGVK